MHTSRDTGCDCVRPGDLVHTSASAVDLNSDGLELYMSDPWKWDSDVTGNEGLNLAGMWHHDAVGVVIESYDEDLFDSHYTPVKVLVGSVVGWTYSDMLTCACHV